MILTEFNELSRDAALSTLRPALDIPRWQEEIVDARPFTSVQSVQELALTAAQPFTETEIDRALAHHPKIGERDGSESAEARLSRAEQASLGSTSDDDAERLKQGNRDYEERFGHVFLIRAAGRSHPEILAELTRRMKNDPQSERAEVAEQLRDIAALRIEGMLS
ncbi:2-oxo-4-hydroxy-4-carboxy-5-ureidoimidazoline decarboxylase [Kocuria massiliensis]|uniref:2-oxo-4-hydroxy-4-carboxy-5-ureidoimidazoline decarboxylase n=1 Tax=Kocuria massiliensis TaxID=1926282 RepID=UPI000A1C9DE0|nr:2-oxo-4-hydroxy-4-carboxy-5-ureidoimidazoline decarboxylase [Kocuria massiliensis]